MNAVTVYDITPHAAEIYDQVETQVRDVQLILNLVQGLGHLRILEPFCGTGRILIPLALAGHHLVGLDKASGMLARAGKKLRSLDMASQGRVSLFETDVVQGDWPAPFDLVILGGNCFYELPTAEEQQKCVMNAASVLKPGGHVYIDNDHMEGELALSWQAPGLRPGFPTGNCIDGTSVETWIETTWFDAPNRLAKFRRLTRVTLPDGKVVEKEYFQQKHPVSMMEVQSWLERFGFIIENLYGDHQGNPYSQGSSRAIFWARKL